MLLHAAVANDRCVGANDQLLRFSLFFSRGSAIHACETRDIAVRDLRTGTRTQLQECRRIEGYVNRINPLFKCYRRARCFSQDRIGSESFICLICISYAMLFQAENQIEPHSVLSMNEIWIRARLSHFSLNKIILYQSKFSKKLISLF